MLFRSDLLRLPPEGRRFTTVQDLAVTSYEHTWSEGVGETSVKVRGKPSSGWYRWARIAAAANPQDMHRVLDRGNSGTWNAIIEGQFRGGAVRPAITAALAALEQQYEVHVSTSPGFTPSSATVKGTSTQPYMAALRPGSQQYAKLLPFVWNDQRLVQGQPSEDIQIGRAHV